MSRSIAVAYSMARKRGKRTPQKGVHNPAFTKGESEAGEYVRDSRETNDKDRMADKNEKAKMEHESVLEEMKSMKGPHGNYADGGEVDKDPVVEKTPDQAGAGPVSQEESKKFAQGMCPSCGYSEGGMVANETGEGASADKSPNEFDDLVLRDGLEFSLDGKNSGDELGGPSKMDLVSRAMLKRKKK